MKFGNQTHWDSKNETIDQWLERERKASRKVEAPTCPHCDHTHDEWWEYSGLSHDYEVEDYKMTCAHCSEDFLVNKETRVRFETKTLSDDEE